MEVSRLHGARDSRGTGRAPDRGAGPDRRGSAGISVPFYRPPARRAAPRRGPPGVGARRAGIRGDAAPRQGEGGGRGGAPSPPGDVRSRPSLPISPAISPEPPPNPRRTGPGPPPRCVARLGNRTPPASYGVGSRHKPEGTVLDKPPVPAAEQKRFGCQRSSGPFGREDRHTPPGGRSSTTRVAIDHGEGGPMSRARRSAFACQGRPGKTPLMQVPQLEGARE